MKHLKHLFTALLLLCSVGTATAHDFEVDGIYYNITSSTDKTVEVTCRGYYYYDYSNEYTGSVVIPESVTYYGTTYCVTSIGKEAFGWCTGLTNIEIPGCVTSIGSSAFSGCKGLTSVTIGNSVTSIGWYAFEHCTGLTSITVPNSVTSIRDYAFYGCDGLTSVVIGNSVTSIGEKAFYGCTGLTRISVESGNTIYDSRENCNAIIETAKNKLIIGCKNTIIPNNITSIGNYAFDRCYGLTSITIPNSVTSIESYAFYGCTGLTSITIPNSVTSIGSDAFYVCRGLTRISVESGNTIYDSRENCNAIIETAKNKLIVGCKNTIIPNNVTSIGDNAFSYCTGLTSITIPNNVTSIGDNAFYGCTGLTSITIHNSVTSIGSSAFYDCSGLTSVEFNAENCTYMGSGSYPVFRNCTALSTVTIGENVKTIPASAFDGCSGITYIEIPNSVTSIGDYAFYGCSGLTSVEYNAENCTRMGSSSQPVFSGCTALSTVTIGENVKTIPASVFYGCSGITYIEIPNSVTSIGSSAFSGCKGLTSVTIGNSVTSIGDYAFAYCTGLTSITIPNSVTSIGNGAFQNCSSLNELRIEDGNNNLSLGYNATNSFLYEGEGLFYDCPLETLYLGRNLSYSSGGDYGYSPFYKTGLTNVTIGNKVTDIGNNLFYQCKTLKELRIEDGEKELAISPNINGSGWIGMFNQCPLEVIYLGRNLSYLTNASSPFYEITELTSVTVGSNVTKLESSMFHKCTGLKTVINLSDLTFTKGSTEYGYIAHYAEKVINAPNSTIDDNFIWSKNENENINMLACYIGDNPELTLPSSFNGEFYVIGDYAFYGCSFLTYINIPDSITSIGEYAFYDCTGLTGIEIPNSVTSIGASAFEGCNNIEKLYIGSSVESIGDKAFTGCEKITEIKVALGKPIRGSANIFTNAVYDNATLYIPNGTEQLYQKREPWNLFFYIAEMDFTGIDEVYDEVKGENGEVKTIYDLSGRAVEKPTKGIYIINGKKCWVSESND